MAQRVPLARAARMLGVSRRRLQAMVRRGELTTFEGCVEMEQLRLRCPKLMLDQSPLFERTRNVREGAFARRVREVAFPDPAELAVQVQRLEAEVVLERVRARRYRDIMEAFLGRLGELHDEADDSQRRLLDSLGRWLSERLESDSF